MDARRKTTYLTILSQNAGNYSDREQQIIQEIMDSSSHLQGEVVGTTSISHLEETLEGYGDMPDIFGIGGGDGTAKATVTKAVKTWRKMPRLIAAYSIGTMNNWTIPFGLHDGFFDYAKRKTGIGDTKPIQLAEHISEVVSSGDTFETQRLGLLKLNDEYAFNVGLGVVPNLLWLYDGRTIGEYDQFLEGEEIPGARKKLPGILRVLHATRWALAGGSGINRSAHEFLNQKLDVDVYVDEEKKKLKAKPSVIMTSTYEQASLGVHSVMPRVLPGAREKEDQMQVMISYLSPLQIIWNLPRILAGKYLPDTEYFHCKQLNVKGKNRSSKLFQADGEMGDVSEINLTLNPQPLEIITLPSR